MKIIIITAGIPRLLTPIVNEFNVIGIIESSPRRNLSLLKKMLRNLSFKYFRHIKKQERSLKFFSKSNELNYRKFQEKGNDLKQWIEIQSPDLILVYSMSHLLKEEIFSIPKYGTINLHPSYLPEFRGPFPEFWYYYNKNLQPGATVHFIDKGEDTGDIICQERTQIPLGIKSEKYFDIIEGDIGVRLIKEAIISISDGSVMRLKQEKKGITPRARNLHPNEHEKIIDWENWEIDRIWHVLRGTEGWLNAIPKPKFPYLGQRWSIGNYKVQKNIDVNNFKILKERGKYFLYLREGVIELEVKFSFIRLLRNILNSGKK